MTIELDQKELDQIIHGLDEGIIADVFEDNDYVYVLLEKLRAARPSQVD